VDAGDQVAFKVSFTPNRLGPQSSMVEIATSDSPSRLTLSAASLAGDAELADPRTDTFIVPAPPNQLDLVWILDNDDDREEVKSVAAVLPGIIDALNAKQVDWQMAVTSTDTCDGGSSDLGFFEPCDHCISQASSTALRVTESTPDAGDALINLFNLFDVAPVLGYCDQLNGDEHFFDSIADAFSTANLAGHNAGFLRAGADLSIVVVNGDDEDDGASVWPGQYLTSLAQATALVEGLEPDAGMATVSYVNNRAGLVQNTQQIGGLVRATGGSLIDSSQAAAIWENELIEAVLLAGETGAFRLSEAAQSVIEVDVNGVALGTGWFYDPFQQEIIFVLADLPAPGSTVTVTYRPGCP